MSFWVWVIRAGDLDWSNLEGERVFYAEYSSEEERKLALDQWQADSDNLNLFSAPLGADGTVYEY
jgi:hypothetical protein